MSYEKVFQTVGAIITSALSKEDAAGHYNQNEFIIFTEPYRAEKLAEFLAFAFDNILKRFYTEFDFANNFVMYSSSSKEEKKISLKSHRQETTLLQMSLEKDILIVQIIMLF